MVSTKRQCNEPCLHSGRVRLVIPRLQRPEERRELGRVRGDRRAAAVEVGELPGVERLQPRVDYNSSASHRLLC